MQRIRIICRDSRLSLLQAELVKQKIVSCTTGIAVDIIGRTSRGDRELSVPLSSPDGTDFFAEDIFDALLKGEAEQLIRSLLTGKKLMFLPLIECVPAPCQGAIVVEANPVNTAMIAPLNVINNEDLLQEALAEKREAYQYGTGCLQSLGVTSITHADGKWMYAAGRDAEGISFRKWHGLPQVEVDDKNVFSTTDYMGQLFKYELYDDALVVDEPVVSVLMAKTKLYAR